MVASLWVSLVTVAAVMVIVAGALLTVGSILVWHFGRRKWRAFRSHGLVTAAVALWGMASTLRRPHAPATPDEMRGWSARQLRSELSRTIDRTEGAISAAAGLGGETSTLDNLFRQLRVAAAELDLLVRMQPAGTVAAGLSDQVAAVCGAASDIQSAALAMATDWTGEQVRHLVTDARHETAAVDAGLASARDALGERAH